MIFFLISNDKRQEQDYKTITDLTEFSDSDIYPKLLPGTFSVIAWNEVYISTIPTKDEPLKGLYKAIMDAAKNDAVCKLYREQAITEFGLDPFLEITNNGNLPKETVEAIMKDTLRDWAHPMIGNIYNSKKVRPANKTEQIGNWEKCNFLKDNQNIKQNLTDLFDYMPELKKSARDQVRICYNIVELARAFIGEVTSYVPRRLEKLFALHICTSLKLHSYQVNFIKKFLQQEELFNSLKNLVEIHNEKTNDIWLYFEYTKYYLSPESLQPPQQKVKSLNGKDLWQLISLLIDSAISSPDYQNKKNKSQNIIFKSCLDVWDTIPSTVRCAILMNDFRKLFISAKSKKNLNQILNLNNLSLTGRNPDKFSMGFGSLPSPASISTSVTYQVIKAAENKHQLPKFKLSCISTSKDLEYPWALAWSWNRDELHMATITYRYFLCPLWAGPSGHTGGGLQFWLEALTSNKSNTQNQAQVSDDLNEGKYLCAVIASGLFTLWRLYYDKRISAMHTLVETYEATCNENVIGNAKDFLFSWKDIKENNIKCTQDDMDLVLLASFPSDKSPINPKQVCVDPILLLRILKIKYYDVTQGTHSEKLEQLNNKIVDAKKTLVNKGYKVIQWSKDISDSQGTKVKGFEQIFSSVKLQHDCNVKYTVTAKMKKKIEDSAHAPHP